MHDITAMSNKPLTKQTIVNVRTGETTEMLVSETMSTLTNETRLEGWFASELTKNGQPDKRVRAHRIGVTKSTYGWSGCWGLLDADREAKAAAVRAEIEAIEKSLSDATNRLMELYR